MKKMYFFNYLILTGHSESVTKVMFDRQKIISLSVDKTMRFETIFK